MEKKRKIFIFGLDRAGKTVTTNYFIKKSQTETYRPTTAFSIKSWNIHKIRFHLWDAPGQENFRKLWIRGIQLADILLFILDTSDNERFNEAKSEMEQILSELPENTAPLLICYHKIDLIKAKENLDVAKSVFADVSILKHDRIDFETSIKDSASLDSVEQYIVDYGLKRSWND